MTRFICAHFDTYKLINLVEKKNNADWRQIVANHMHYESKRNEIKNSFSLTSSRCYNCQFIVIETECVVYNIGTRIFIQVFEHSFEFCSLLFICCWFFYFMGFRNYCGSNEKWTVKHEYISSEPLIKHLFL